MRWRQFKARVRHGWGPVEPEWARRVTGMLITAILALMIILVAQAAGGE